MILKVALYSIFFLLICVQDSDCSVHKKTMAFVHVEGPYHAKFGANRPNGWWEKLKLNMNDKEKNYKEPP